MEEFLKQCIREAGELSMQYYRQSHNIHTKKNKSDIVTEADIAVSNFLIKKIIAEYPEHSILSEENNQFVQKEADYEWVIDPIDGTWMFAHDMWSWGIMIAIVSHDEPILAAIYLPVTNDLFFAKKDNGAYWNDKKIQVNTTDEIDFARCMLDYSATSSNAELFKKSYVKFITETTVKIANLRSAASHCFLANGSFDFIMGNAGYDWDKLAPVLICREAGAKVTDGDGNEWKRGSRDIIMANPVLHKKVLAFMHE